VAPLLCAGITTYAPYKDHGFDQPGKKVGVVGLGGLGHMAVKFGVAFGCEVYVISRNRNKEEQAKAMGAKAVIPSVDKAELEKFEGAAGVVCRPGPGCRQRCQGACTAHCMRVPWVLTGAGRCLDSIRLVAGVCTPALQARWTPSSTP
jgi:Zn-dependent alcohol dehydrogenase